MTLETIKDILDWTRRLHAELAETYRMNSNAFDDERAKLLINYVADHEARIAETIKHYEDDASVQTMDTWIQDNLQTNPFVKNMQTMFGIPGFSSDEVLDQTVKFHQGLVSMYAELAQSAQSERVRELFQNLESMEQHELMRMVHTAERFNDL